MWRIYVILVLWTQSLNGQQEAFLPNSQEGGRGQAPIGYNENNSNRHLANRSNNTSTYSQQLPVHTYTNSRDSFVNKNNLEETHLFSRIEPLENKTTHNENNLSTRSPINTQPSSQWKISIGDSFNKKLFDVLSSKAQYENLVYSPISLQTVLAFIFTMSSGQLYEELAQLLAISNNRTYVAETFEKILQASGLNTPPTTLVMANKLYYDYRFGPLDHSVRAFAKQSFDSEMEPINFFAGKKAASIINSWVNEKTRNLIQDIVTPSTISGDTSALLLNSIYFKSEWLTKFSIHDTEIQDFFVTRQTKIPVHMMYNEDVFRYGEFAEDLQASVVELPYKKSNISMLLILPKDAEGLPALERKLNDYDFQSISQRLKRHTVTVKMPRFNIEYEIDMIQPLQKMGLNALFNNAGSINLFKNQQKPLKVDQLKHKSFIHVNEAGTEAAATTVAKYIPLSLPIDMKYFIANHPFIFVIRDANTTFFIGHVVNFS